MIGVQNATMLQEMSGASDMITQKYFDYKKIVFSC